MKKFKPKRTNPERKIQNAIVSMLRTKGWFVIETHGNMFQRGLPDVFASHVLYGMRWIEVKNPSKYKFTPAQLLYFPQFVANGAPIWILTGSSETEYRKLFKRCNWHSYYYKELIK